MGLVLCYNDLRENTVGNGGKVNKGERGSIDEKTEDLWFPIKTEVNLTYI